MQTFEFVNSSGRRLTLFGQLISHSEEVQTGVAERQIIKLPGALHQLVGSPPRKWQFQCNYVGRGDDEAARSIDADSFYQRLTQTVLEDPFGQLTHPRLGNIPAVCEAVAPSENYGEARNSIEFSIRFAEDQLRTAPAPSPIGSAQAAVAQAAAAVSLSVREPVAVQAQASDLATACDVFLSAASAVQSSGSPLAGVEAALAAVFARSEVLMKSASSVDLRVSAMLSYRYARESYGRVIAGRPPVVRYVVQARTSLSRLVAQLYGGGSRALDGQILALNKIPMPHALAVGSVLSIPAPDVVRAQIRVPF